MNELLVINISAYEANLIKKLPLNYALISINDEDSPLFPLRLDRNHEKIFTVQFTDIITSIIKNGKIYNPLSQNLAAQIANFIERYKDNNFIIHCHAGVSRSSAVALFIHLKYGHKLKDNFWFYSNPNVQTLGMLTRESERKGVLCF